MDNKTLAQIIQNNIRVKNLEAESGSGDIVIYDNADGASLIEDIALEIGATYEMFITSAFNNNSGVQYGQQKITLKLIPAEVSPNNYAFYIYVNFFDTSSIQNLGSYINIFNIDTELWTIFCAIGDLKIYKIVKKAV